MSIGRTSKYEAVGLSAEQQNVWKCGIYLRLSREDGDKLESDSIINQRKIIERHLTKNPDIEIYDTYVDDGFTGSNFNRPEMKRLLDDIKSRKVNCLIVKDLSRFGRNYYETGRYLEVVFPLLRVRFIAVNDMIDSYKNPQSMKNSSVSFKNVINDEYGKDISNKVKSSFRAKQKRGEYLGTYALYGYTKDPNDHHKLIIDEEAAENVRLIYRMFLDGFSIYNIALKLNERGIENPTAYRQNRGLKSNRRLKFDQEHSGWSTQTIRRMLKNQMYIGNMVQGRTQTINNKVRRSFPVSEDRYIIKEGTHESIIDKETFEEVQKRFRRDTWQPKAAEASPKKDLDTGAIYVGYIKCEDCGRAMQRSGYMDKGNSLYYFVCGSYLQWKQCTRHAVRVKKLNEIVLTVIRKYVDVAVEMDGILQAICNQPIESIVMSRIKKDIKACEAEREKTIKFQNDLYIDYKDEILTREQYIHFKKEYKEKLDALELRLKTLNEELSRSDTSVTQNSFVETFKKYRNITELSREVIVELIDMIYVDHNGGIRIRFRFQDDFQKATDVISVNTEYKLSVSL